MKENSYQNYCYIIGKLPLEKSLSLGQENESVYLKQGSIYGGKKWLGL